MANPEIHLVTQPNESIESKTLIFLAQLPISTSNGVAEMDVPATLDAFRFGAGFPKDILAHTTRGLLLDEEIMQGAVRAFLKEYSEVTIEDLNLSVRLYNLLKQKKINNMRELLSTSMGELKEGYGMGIVSMGELKDNLAEHGIWPFNQEALEEFCRGKRETTYGIYHQAWREFSHIETPEL